MKKLVSYIATFLFLIGGLASCGDLVYEKEEDCSVTYYLTFTHFMNLRWADAFPAEVTSVRVYAFDEEGVLAWYAQERGDLLSIPGYKMKLDLKPGKYKIVSWCGVDNGLDSKEESFTVSDHEIGVTTLHDLTCRLNRKYDAEKGAHSDKPLYFLYHGSIDAEIEDLYDGVDRSYNIDLTKDTNNIRIVLQHLSEESLRAEDFSFRIEDANGHLGHDNTLLDDENITYYPFRTLTGSATVGKEEPGADSRAMVTVDGVIADLHVGRLMADRKSKMMLTIGNNKTGETVAQIPLIDYALLSKDYYEQSYRRLMSDQEFLDREDNYVFTFFLDKQDHWLNTSILIHSWRIVLQDVGFTDE